MATFKRSTHCPHPLYVIGDLSEKGFPEEVPASLIANRRGNTEGPKTGNGYIYEGEDPTGVSYAIVHADRGEPGIYHLEEVAMKRVKQNAWAFPPEEQGDLE